MKTPMMELIWKLNKVEPQHFCSIETIKGWAEELLEKEKEAIMNAYDIGWSDGNKDQDLNDLYYNETFNTNQENLPDSTNGYTYYPQENKTVFNTKEK